MTVENDDELNGIEPLTEAEAAVSPLMEAATSQIIVPKKGKVLAEDGSCGLIIMRPCVSRGRRLKGLPPIYESTMLARYAGVFKNWPMFMDHVPPELAEAMAKHGRSVRELGGRIIESWFDPNVVMEYDEEFGYKPGAVVGRAIPQDPVAGMIAKDPDVLHCSINAWPTGAKPGKAYGKAGMLVSGIRAKPIGSVDWVIRGGAGGRVMLSEAEQQAEVGRVVSMLHEHYSSGHAMTEPVDFSKMTPAELRTALAESERPELVALLREESAPASTTAAAAAAASGLTAEQAKAIAATAVAEAEERWTTKSTELRESAESRVAELVQERESQRSLASEAHKLIEAAKLPSRIAADLKSRYAVLPSGATPALALVEAVTGDEPKSEVEVLRERVEADIEHCRAIVAEAVGAPVVTGQGGGAQRTGAAETTPFWRTRMQEMGVVEKADDALTLVESAGGNY